MLLPLYGEIKIFINRHDNLRLLYCSLFRLLRGVAVA